MTNEQEPRRILVVDDQQEIHVPIRLAVFPNPLSKNDLLQVVANKNVTVQVLDVLGNKLSEPMSLSKGELLEFKLELLRSGLYLINAEDAAGARTSSRFILSN